MKEQTKSMTCPYVNSSRNVEFFWTIPTMRWGWNMRISFKSQINFSSNESRMILYAVESSAWKANVPLLIKFIPCSAEKKLNCEEWEVSLLKTIFSRYKRRAVGSVVLCRRQENFCTYSQAMKRTFPIKLTLKKSLLYRISSMPKFSLLSTSCSNVVIVAGLVFKRELTMLPE